MEEVFFNKFLFEKKIGIYLNDEDLKSFNQTCKESYRVSKSSLSNRQLVFFKNEYIRRFRNLYDRIVTFNGTISIRNLFKLCDFVIKKQYITLLFFRNTPALFVNFSNILEQGLNKYNNPNIIYKINKYSDRIQKIYSNTSY